MRHWKVAGTPPVLLKHRENAVFRVTLANGDPAALRLHRPAYHGEGALRSELALMAALKQGGLLVPSPIAGSNGDPLVRLAANAALREQYADIISWVEGPALGQSGRPLSHGLEDQQRIFFAIGAATARMHGIADAWKPPERFTRPAWDIEGLLGEAPVWGRFWDCPGLEPAQQRQLTTLRRRLKGELKDVVAAGLDYGLIHADLVRENVMLVQDGVALIDFDDAGFGYRLFDLATTLLKNRSEPSYPDIEKALVAGYRSCRDLGDESLRALPLFLVLRSLTYIGWIADRPEAPNARDRLARYVAESLSLVRSLGWEP